MRIESVEYDEGRDMLNLTMGKDVELEEGDVLPISPDALVQVLEESFTRSGGPGMMRAIENTLSGILEHWDDDPEFELTTDEIRELENENTLVKTFRRVMSKDMAYKNDSSHIRKERELSLKTIFTELRRDEILTKAQQKHLMGLVLILMARNIQRNRKVAQETTVLGKKDPTNHDREL